MEDPRITHARKLFAAWSSGDADAPAPLLSSDAVLYDIVGGTKHGWPEIRAFFAEGLVAWPDLVLEPEMFWTNDEGVALSWTMSATVPDDRFGERHRGKRWRSEGMTYLVFRDGLVVHEVDYHHGGNVVRSLEEAG